MTPALETLCFRVHRTHLLPIADARVRTITPDSTDLACLLESTSPGTDTIMEHHRRNADGAGGLDGARLSLLNRLRFSIANLRTTSACGLEAQPETQRFTANPESVTQCAEAWPSRSDTSARPLGTLWGERRMRSVLVASLLVILAGCATSHVMVGNARPRFHLAKSRSICIRRRSTRRSRSSIPRVRDRFLYTTGKDGQCRRAAEG